MPDFSIPRKDITIAMDARDNPVTGLYRGTAACGRRESHSSRVGVT
jgi:hypothetical protein